MKKSRLTEEQITFALRQTEATFYLWKKNYTNLGALELRELRQLRECGHEPVICYPRWGWWWMNWWNTSPGILPERWR